MRLLESPKKKRRLRLCFTCSDFVHHEHRYRWTARLCGRVQRRLLLARGWWRCFGLGGNACPACNSSAPEVDTCPICKGYDSRREFYPPQGQQKEAWWARFRHSLGC